MAGAWQFVEQGKTTATSMVSYNDHFHETSNHTFGVAMLKSMIQKDAMFD